MKFFKTLLSRTTSFALQRAVLLISVCLAIGIWFNITLTDKMEKDITINITYKNLPSDRIITSGRVVTANALINGPEILMSSLHKNYSIDIDVSKVKVGKETYNTFALMEELKKNFSSSVQRGFTIINIQPSIITLSVEYIEKINVNLDVEYKSEGNQYAINAYPHYPQTVTLIGPKSEIDQLKHLSSLPVDVFVDHLELGKDVSREVPVIIPAEYNCPLVQIEPSSTRVRYKVIGERVNISYTYAVHLSVKDPNMYIIDPENIVLTLKVPSNRQRDTEYLNSLHVTALPPNLANGETKVVKVNFTTPDGMEVVGGQTTVKITRKNMKKENESDLTNNVILRQTNNDEESARNQRRNSIHKNHKSLQSDRETRPSHKTGSEVQQSRKESRQEQNSKSSTKKETGTGKKDLQKSPTSTKEQPKSSAKPTKTPAKDTAQSQNKQKTP